MLRFIFSHFAHSSEEYLFQYISCYGLSFPKSNRRRRKNNFNTSHVTVYQKSSISSTIRKTISIHLMLRFIPRRRQYKKAKWEISIHLMLRFIRLKKPIWVIIGDFNTSHVTVYPSIHRYIICHDRISIHLMLRFIKTWVWGYIGGAVISIHLMLRFIFRKTFLSFLAKFISIHLMLRFIWTCFDRIPIVKRFHVTVYQLIP